MGINHKEILGFKEGDTLVITGNKLVNAPIKIEMIKVTSHDGIEIIFDKKKNSFFNLGMYLNGKSWVKEAKLLP